MANFGWKTLGIALKSGIVIIAMPAIMVLGILVGLATAVTYAAMARKAVVAAVIIFGISPAMAQQASPEVRAYQQTVGELNQAWVGARAALIAAQDQHIADLAKIAALEAKLPRQEPVKGPSGDGPHRP